jgi:hypothetical protein
MIAEIATMISVVLVFVLTGTILVSTAMAVSYGAQFVSSSLKSALCSLAIVSCEKSSKPVIQGDKVKGA